MADLLAQAWEVSRGKSARFHRAIRKPYLLGSSAPTRAQAGGKRSVQLQVFASSGPFRPALESTFPHNLHLLPLAGVGQGQGVTESSHSQIQQSEKHTVSKQTAATSKPNIYQAVTDRIIASLKECIIPWEKPWQAPTFAGGNFPRNFRTGKPYRGINVFLLWSTPYSAPFWLTYKQAEELGGAVCKGEKGTTIVFYKQLSGKKNDSEQTEEQPDEQDIAGAEARSCSPATPSSMFSNATVSSCQTSCPPPKPTRVK